MNDTYDHRIPDLIIDYTTEGLIELRQQNGLDEPSFIELHPMHVRLIAEKVGMASQPVNTSEPLFLEQIGQQLKTISRLRRDMLRLRDKATDVQKAIANGDWDHADLAHEMGQANALVDLCDMAVDDFVDDFEGREPAKLAPGVLWQGSNGGRQIDPKSLASSTPLKPLRPSLVKAEPKGKPETKCSKTGQLGLEPSP